ncbi:MAG: hypothetical protein HY976_00790 [Candidatus Kerfeldbacteria bacterium]|nr:hypothetical protein [Candidatus Kerfeldbacteria bacterium]
MNSSIIPAVLEYGVRKTQVTIDRFRPLRSPIHLDVTDGSLFGQGKNLLPEDLRRLKLPARTTVHLMVRHPGTWLRACYAARIKQVVLHIEADVTPELLAEAQYYFRLIIAIAPGTPLSALAATSRFAEGYQVMTVRPGAQGRTFLGSQLRLVQNLRGRYPRSLIAVDGGVNPMTGRAARVAGADTLIVGSWLAKSRTPVKAYRELVSAVKTVS